jgi:hypothetical protein
VDQSATRLAQEFGVSGPQSNYLSGIQIGPDQAPLVRVYSSSGLVTWSYLSEDYRGNIAQPGPAPTVSQSEDQAQQIMQSVGGGLSYSAPPTAVQVNSQVYLTFPLSINSIPIGSSAHFVFGPNESLESADGVLAVESGSNSVTTDSAASAYASLSGATNYCLPLFSALGASSAGNQKGLEAQVLSVSSGTDAFVDSTGAAVVLPVWRFAGTLADDGVSNSDISDTYSVEVIAASPDQVAVGTPQCVVLS